MGCSVSSSWTPPQANELADGEQDDSPEVVVRKVWAQKINLALGVLGKTADGSFELYDYESLVVKQRNGQYKRATFPRGTSFTAAGCYVGKKGYFIYLFRENIPTGSQWVAVEIPEGKESLMTGFPEALMKIMKELTGEPIMPGQVGNVSLRRNMREVREKHAVEVAAMQTEAEANPLFGSW